MGRNAAARRSLADVTEREGRAWGFWTRAKLAVLEDYLPAFLQASKNRASEYVYLDAFAGDGTGIDRLTREEFKGSCRIALDAAVAGGFTRLRFFERTSKAAELETALRAEYANRDIRVYGGDCNRQIPNALAELQSVRWAPTFAFIDPDGMEFAWTTLAALAKHKEAYRPPGSTKPNFKVELWLLFPTSGIVRTLAHDPAKMTGADAERATRLFGTTRWRSIYDARVANLMGGREAMEEYVNLMRWLLENRLGYASTHPLELRNTRGATIYHMIFATDHPAGERIMSDLYTKAARDEPAMRREARDRQKGQYALPFDDMPVSSTATYHYAPPWTPPGSDNGE